MTGFSLELLERAPDLGGPNLFAVDASDRLLLDTAAAELRAAAPGSVTVIGDRYGALTLGALALHGAAGVRTHQDPLLGELALARNAEAQGITGFQHHDLSEELLTGATVVLLQLPRSLDALDEIARAIARWADPAARVFAAGRVKHMSLGMNEVLARSFASVTPQLARQKSRVLIAEGALPQAADPYPLRGEDPDLPFALFAHGAAFNGPRLDHGTRLLLDVLDEAAPEARRILDLGCGTGSLATSLALARPEAEVIASDQSAAAVRSARATADAAGVGDRVRTVRADGVGALPAGSVDLIVLNPPFHNGATVDTSLAHRLIRGCRRVLAPGGELWVVYNTPLGYGPLIEREIGPSRTVAATKTFLVTAAVRRGGAGKPPRVPRALPGESLD
ncbi:class I SAM-dependent methyltransferase [Leucobacter sp. M11]|uniref:class I SAM-dependent methyltransferase n=1 Tax=Leucobacter sp. M11 TaxID=2993565 RepID=UPI002D806505|nr:methyltransferase [Leucobacter sp. M11]MEB4614824.1 methyltransferase [Leucobacter sp. M11]